MINSVTAGAVRPFLIFSIFVLASVLFDAAGLRASARRDWQPTQESKKRPITVTGCLEKGAGDDAVVISGQDGSMYLLKSADIDLKAHIKHKVTLTGKVTEIDDDEEGSDEYRESGVMMLVVTNLKVISVTCK